MKIILKFHLSILLKYIEAVIMSTGKLLMLIFYVCNNAQISGMIILMRTKIIIIILKYPMEIVMVTAIDPEI